MTEKNKSKNTENCHKRCKSLPILKGSRFYMYVIDVKIVIEKNDGNITYISILKDSSSGGAFKTSSKL